MAGGPSGTAETIACGHEQNENPEGTGSDCARPLVVAETFYARAASVGKMPTSVVSPKRLELFFPPFS